MKYIKMFLASSIDEFSEDRQLLKSFISRLNDIYVHRDIYLELDLCENLPRAIQKYGSQEMYNNRIRECQYFFVLVGKSLGEFTLQEFEVASDHFRKNDTPFIYPFFRQYDDLQSVSASVAAFRERLEREFKYYYSFFTDVNTLKLNMLLEFVSNPEISGFVSFRDGQAVVDSQPVLDLQEIPFYRNSTVLSDLRRKKQDLEIQSARLSAEYKQGHSAEKYKEWMKVENEKEEISKKYFSYEEELLKLFFEVTELKKTDRQLSWREQQACRMIDAGNAEAAIELLRDSSRAKELSMMESLFETGRAGILAYISENRLLLNLLMTSADEKDILPEVTKCFTENLNLERLYHVDYRCYSDYIEFLYNQKDYLNARSLIEELFEKYDVDRLEDSGTIFYQAGEVYLGMYEQDEAEKYFRKALSTCNSRDYMDPLEYARYCNGLGVILSEDPSRLREAEHYYQEGLASLNAGEKTHDAQRQDLYANIGALMHAEQRNGEAEDYYKKALEICTSRGEESIPATLPRFCTILNNLGNVYRDIRRFDDAEKAFETAVFFLEFLSSVNPHAYLPELARTYNNYGLTLSIVDTMRAEELLRKALKIRRKLYKKDPASYRHDVAQTENNLASLLSGIHKGKNHETESLFKEALKLRKTLDPGRYLYQVAQTHHDFAKYYAVAGNRQGAEVHYRESVKLFEESSRSDSMADYWKAQALNDYGAFLFNDFYPHRSSEAMIQFSRAMQALKNYDCSILPFSYYYEMISNNISIVLSDMK